MDETKRLQLFWLGTPMVVLEGKPVKFETRKALALLVYLSQESRSISREALAALFWPEYPQQKAFANLRRNLASLCQSLSSDWLLATRDTIGMESRQDLWLDTVTFRQYHSVVSENRIGSKNGEQAVALYRGPFLEAFNLPDCPDYDDWQLFQREEYHREFSALLQKLIRQYSSASDWEPAIRFARKWVSLDKLHEPAQQSLTQLYLQSGQHSAAIQQFETYQRLLRQELNQDPGPEIVHLFQAIRSEKQTRASQTRTEMVTTADPHASSTQRQALEILKTKLFIPNIRQKRVERTQLLKQLNQALDYRLILISAPAGYGKSTLLGSWVRQCPHPVAWLSLDADDNDPLRFIKYITTALQSVVPESLNLQEISPPTSLFAFSPAVARNYLVSILNRLCEINEPTFLILDDYHFIRNNDVNELTAFLIEKMPEPVHIILSTRTDPLFPLARLRSLGLVMELRADDLRLTLLETTQFLNETMSLDLDAQSVAALEERTEGWIAGLQMASIAMQSNLSMHNRRDMLNFIHGFSGTNRFILDYLVEEVLASQPADVQQFLLCTSILDRLTAPLCDFLLKDDLQAKTAPTVLSHLPSTSILDDLWRQNLFLVPLDEDAASGAGAGWFRYHHLFAELLKARLYQIRPHQVAVLHRRASGWLEQNGYIHQAVQHRVLANDTVQAAELIEQYGPVYLSRSDPSILQAAETLPQEVVAARPRLGLYLAWLQIIQGRIGEARPLLKSLARQLSSQPPDSEQRWMHAVIGSALAFLSPPASAAEYVPLPEYHLLEEIPADEMILTNAAEILYGMALARRGEILRAVEIAVACIQREKKFQGTYHVPTLVPFLSRMYLMLGRLNACSVLCHEYLDPLENQANRFMYINGSMQVDLGEVLFERNCLEEAERFIREGLLANETWRNIMTDGFGLIALTRTLLAKGDKIGAMEAFEKLENRLRDNPQPREFDEDSRTLQIRIQLAIGDLNHPSRWADEVFSSDDYRVHPEYYRLTLAHVRMAQNRYADVEAILTGFTPVISVGSLISKRIEADLLMATAVYRQQRLQEAISIFENCLALAEPEGYLRVFVGLGESARDLLNAYIQSAAPVHRQYAQKVLDLLSG